VREEGERRREGGASLVCFFVFFPCDSLYSLLSLSVYIIFLCLFHRTFLFFLF